MVATRSLPDAEGLQDIELDLAYVAIKELVLQSLPPSFVSTLTCMEEHVVTGRVDKGLLMSILTDRIKALAISTLQSNPSSANQPNRQTFHVDKFTGARGCDPRTWMKVCIPAAEGSGCVAHDSQLLRMFKMHMDEGAWAWIERMEREQGFMTFTEVCTKFFARFEPSLLIRKARLESLRQKEGERVQDVATRFHAMQAFLETAEILQVGCFVAYYYFQTCVSGCSMHYPRPWIRPGALRFKQKGC
jgi:hypothetical protein